MHSDTNERAIPVFTATNTLTPEVWKFMYSKYRLWSKSVLVGDVKIRGADPGGAGGAAAPPILILVVQTYHFAPPIIPVHK